MKRKPGVKVQSNEPSLFFMNFQGELMNFLLDTSLNSVVETEEGIQSTEMPLSIQGYLVDEDDQFYYIGDIPPNLDKITIDKAVSKSRVILAQILQIPDQLTQILDDIPKPKRGDFN